MVQGRDDEYEDCLEMARALLGGYEGAGDLWEANDHINRALRLKPSEPEAWILKSQILSSLDDDPAFRQTVFDLGGRWTVPLVLIDGEPVGGFRELAALDRAGVLEALAERLAA